MKQLCDYGCNQIATHQFKNGKLCCEKSKNKCPNVRKNISIKLKGRATWNKGQKNIYSQETKQQMRDSHKGEKNYWYGKKLSVLHKKNIGVAKKGKKLSDTHKKTLSKVRKGNNHLTGFKHKKVSYDSRRLTIEKIKKRYPLFSKIEELRNNPHNKREVQIHCKYNECKNSKEKEGWFTPTYIQLYERIRAIEKNGVDHAYFYCSEECKQKCPAYNSRGDFTISIAVPYTREEIDLWNHMVLRQDDYECQKCGSTENLHCHHIIPLKENQMLALDPDNGIVLCQKCHYEIGHKTGTECSTGNLANKCKKD